MVKDMCAECDGVTPERCCERKDGPHRHQFSHQPPAKEHPNVSDEKPSTHDDSAVRNPWGPVLQSRSNFLEMHLC